MKNVAVLGATGLMGQTFVCLLSRHPWFKVSAVAASDKSVGKKYLTSFGNGKEIELVPGLEDLRIAEPKPTALDDPDIVFSALPSSVAGPIEEEFAQAGLPVFSNASSHRMDPNVPLLNPEVNEHHVVLLEEQKRRMKRDGFIVANPNCTTSILTLSLKPLLDKFGLETVIVSSMQSVSGAGYPGVASLDILQNVVPFIKNEEEKVQQETAKILGTPNKPADVKVSASCHRVPTLNGHLEAVFAKTVSKSTPEEAIDAMTRFESSPQKLRLPSSPKKPIMFRPEEDRPQTRLDVDEGNGMAVTIGRVRQDPALHGLKYIVLGHNLVRGGAGCSILNAELLLSRKVIE